MMEIITAAIAVENVECALLFPTQQKYDKIFNIRMIKQDHH